jgi:hypothetical protein
MEARPQRVARQLQCRQRDRQDEPARAASRAQASGRRRPWVSEMMPILMAEVSQAPAMVALKP